MHEFWIFHSIKNFLINTHKNIITQNSIENLQKKHIVTLYEVNILNKCILKSFITIKMFHCFNIALLFYDNYYYHFLLLIYLSLKRYVFVLLVLCVLLLCLMMMLHCNLIIIKMTNYNFGFKTENEKRNGT